VTERTEAVLAAARTQGLSDADIQTGAISVFPEVDHQARRVVGYVAGYTLSLRMREMARVSAVMDALAQAAGDALRLGGFRLSSAAAGEARAEAGVRAVEDARRRAQQLAEAAGVRLGRVLSVVETAATTPDPGPRPMRAFAASAWTAGVPVEAGSQEVSTKVVVRFEIAG
jgi:hypothetical protein